MVWKTVEDLDDNLNLKGCWYVARIVANYLNPVTLRLKDEFKTW